MKKRKTWAFFFSGCQSENSPLPYLQHSLASETTPSTPCPQCETVAVMGELVILFSVPEGLSAAVIWKLMAKVCHSCQEPVTGT